MTRTVLIRPLSTIGALVAVLLLLGACSDDGDEGASTSDGPTVVATHSILGDLVENVVGDQAQVSVVMPAGTDPHEFEPSAAQIAELQEADLVVANGLDFEEGLEDALEAAEEAGVPVLQLAERLDPIPFAEPHEHEDEGEGDDHAEDGETDGDDDHADDETDGGDDHAEDEHGDEDPHWFTDPQRAAAAVDEIAASITEQTDLDVSADAEAYAAQLRDADLAIEQQLEEIPEDQRVMLTNHEVFGYFADRYGFEVVGVVVPGGTTLAEPSSADLADLVEEVEEEGVAAIFADSSSSTDLADALAAETGQDVEVVSLFTESLGEPGSGGETYLELIQTNADRITDALS